MSDSAVLLLLLVFVFLSAAVKCGGNRAIISDLSTQTNPGVLSGARRSSRGPRPHYRYAPRSWLASGLVQDIQFVVLSGLGLGGGWGVGSARFGHANEFMGDWLIKGQAGSLEGNIIVRCRSDMMTKSICGLVLIESGKRGGPNDDKRLLMTDFLGGGGQPLSWGGAMCYVVVLRSRFVSSSCFPAMQMSSQFACLKIVHARSRTANDQQFDFCA